MNPRYGIVVYTLLLVELADNVTGRALKPISTPKPLGPGVMFVDKI